MVSGVTTTFTVPVRSQGFDKEAIIAGLGKSPQAQAAYEQSLEQAKQTFAAEIPDDSDVPSDVTDVLRQLDLLGGSIGWDNDPNTFRLDGSDNSPVAPRFQDALTQLSLKVQASTAGKSDDAKGAILAYVAHALTLIDNKFQNTQDNISVGLSQAAAQGAGQEILPNGKGQGTNTFDEIQTQRDNVKDTLHSLLGSSSLENVVDQFSKASYAGLQASESHPSGAQDYSAALKTLSDTVAGVKSANSAAEKSFLAHLTKDFGQGLDTTFTQAQNLLAGGLARATDSSTIDAIKSLDAQLDGYKDLTSTTFAKLLQQLSGSNNQQSSSASKTGLFFNVKA
jgi:hypothetical protein